MLAKRIIACLDVRDGLVVKGTQFKDHEIVGPIEDLAIRYRDTSADELVFYDITASTDRRRVSRDWVTKIARILNIPFCVAGGIRSAEDAAEILGAGADKISINTPALENPALITELARKFGQQCVVVGVDSRLTENTDPLLEENVFYEVCAYTGRASTLTNTRRKTLDWLKEVEDRGAGEVVLNCMNRDGTGNGYDIQQLRLARETLTIPLIASGGARTAYHFAEVFREAQVDGALGARAFHSGTLQIPALKEELAQLGIPIRYNAGT